MQKIQPPSPPKEDDDDYDDEIDIQRFICMVT
jgi:hypothetical protein